MRIGPDSANPSVARRTESYRSSGIADQVAVLFLRCCSRLLNHLRSDAPDYSIGRINFACLEEIS